MMAGPGRSGPRTALAEINVTPLVDVMLVLLIIFMVSAPMLTRGIDISLPQAVSAEAIEEERVTIQIDRAGQYYVAGSPVVDDLLIEEVRRRGGDRPNAAVFLEADAAVAYGRVLAAMDALRTAGISRVSMVTEPIVGPPAANPSRGSAAGRR
ncbi:MAG: ExbD/TolR family protein [Acidobacteriota bacterium]|nr:ExbD/TolR family protein [Acidobacteriota bacterium]MDQ7087532.1 ExbD/TolR family protein [Acidobacteriota bacterium]